MSFRSSDIGILASGCAELPTSHLQSMTRTRFKPCETIWNGMSIDDHVNESLRKAFLNQHTEQQQLTPSTAPRRKWSDHLVDLCIDYPVSLLVAPLQVITTNETSSAERAAIEAQTKYKESFERRSLNPLHRHAHVVGNQTFGAGYGLSLMYANDFLSHLESKGHELSSTQWQRQIQALISRCRSFLICDSQQLHKEIRDAFDIKRSFLKRKSQQYCFDACSGSLKLDDQLDDFASLLDKKLREIVHLIDSGQIAYKSIIIACHNEHVLRSSPAMAELFKRKKQGYRISIVEPSISTIAIFGPLVASIGYAVK